MYSTQGYSFPHEAFSSLKAQQCFEKYIQLEQKLDIDPLSFSFKTHTALPWVREICMTPKILDRVGDILGEDILCWSSSFFTKKPESGKFVSMHEDSLYFQPTEPDNVVTVWLAINPTRQETGCMEYVPGSHKNDYMHKHLQDKNNLLPKGQTVQGDFQTVPVELAPGEFSMHHIKLLHQSGKNTTKRYRIGLVLRYCKPSCRIQMFSEPSAITVRGTNTNTEYWQEDYIPKQDLDIAGLEYIKYTIDKDFTNE